MALGWFGILSKVVPWGDVIDAAPQIVKGAKQLFRSTRGGGDVGNGSDGAKLADPGSAFGALQARVAAVETERRESAALIQSLAEQNARLVGAVEILRLRTRILMIACGGLAVAVVALAGWIATK